MVTPILAYISPTSRLYLAYISPISRPYLAHSSPISRQAFEAGTIAPLQAKLSAEMRKVGLGLGIGGGVRVSVLISATGVQIFLTPTIPPCDRKAYS